MVKEQVSFLFSHHSLHGDTLDTVNTTFRQLNELRTQFDRATNITHAERMIFEGRCRDSKKQVRLSERAPIQRLF